MENNHERCVRRLVNDSALDFVCRCVGCLDCRDSTLPGPAIAKAAKPSAGHLHGPASPRTYIPEPRPVHTPIVIRAHNCPLWEADKPEMSFLFQFPLPFLCDLGAAEISSGLIAPDFLRPQHGCGEKAGPASRFRESR